MAKPKYTHHPDYWIPGGDLYLRVEQTLFRVHSYFFIRESKHWKDELVGPISPGDEALKKGQEEKEAIVIDAKAEEFARFLWVFYNDTYGNYSKASTDQWKAIMRFAGKWGFNEVKELSVRHLQDAQMGLVERIQLYQENRVPEKHLFRLYVELASREELPGLEDARALGLETYVAVQQARERLRGQVPAKPPYNSPIREGLKQKDIVGIVASTFKLSLADVDPAPGSN